MPSDDPPPFALIEVAVEPQTRADRTRLISVLDALESADPNFTAKIDEESGQIILGGVSEAHLDGMVGALRQTHEIALIVGAPQVAYREALIRRVEQDYAHKKQTGGTGQFARVTMIFEPNEPGGGNVFESKVIGAALPEDYVAGVEKGIASVMRSGVLAGFPLLDTRATLIDGAFHEVDSSALAFAIAARAAFREALQKGGSVLLEPIMQVEVVTPDAYLGSVIGDLRSRRGTMPTTARTGGSITVSALVPLINMFGYAAQLQAFSQGRASFTMRFERFEPVLPLQGGDPPPAIAAALRA